MNRATERILDSEGILTGSQEEEIKTMKLYSEVDRIYNDLKKIGYGRSDPLKVEDVNKFDHYHYYGAKTIDEFIKKLNIKKGSAVLDIGSGLGGTARYIAAKTGCRITAVELQTTLNDVARDLTLRCGLEGDVNHVVGDILEMNLGVEFDYVVCWLSAMHISDKDKLYQACFDHLKPGGKIYIEDCFLLNELSENENSILVKSISCQWLPTRQQFTSQLEKVGLHVNEFLDVTSDWSVFVADRFNQFVENRDDYVSTHNVTSYKSLRSFYADVDTLFKSGNVGGCKVTATKI